MNSSHTNPPGCEADLFLGARLQQPSFTAQACLIFIVITNMLTFTFTAVLNALVMIVVKTKSRLRAHKSNILLAMLAFTDFVVGILGQPVFIAVLIMFLIDEPSAYCLLHYVRPIIGGLTDASLFHLVLISGERYLAMKHPFAYTTLVTEARLLVASLLVWLLSGILQVLFLVNQKTVVMHTKTTSIALSIAFIVFCHVAVYRETRRHEQQLAAQQVTQEAREKFEKDRKSFKLTAIVIAVVVLCYLPFDVLLIIASSYRSELTIEAMYMFYFSALWIILLNSLINPIIYSIRMKRFRVAFIELICGSANIAEAKGPERRLFGAPNAVALLEEEQELEEQDQQNVEQASEKSSDNHNDNVLPQNEN